MIKVRELVMSCSLLLVAACASPPSTPPQSSSPQAPLADASDAAVKKAIDDITTFPTQLDPRIWDGSTIKPDVRDAIQRVVRRVVDESGIEGLTVDAVDLFGSNASYEYDDKSDVGVHAFVHVPGMSDAELTPFMHLLNDGVEQRQEGRIRFYGLPLELTFHAGRSANYESRAGIGQYSVSEGRWIVEPVKQPDNFDRDQMKVDAKKFIDEYNALVREYESAKKGFDCHRFNDLDDEMSAYRNSGFTQGRGSRSTQNLTYRALRRLNVEVPEMVDTLHEDCTFVNESVG